MRMRKIAFALALVLAVLTFAGCNGGGENTSSDAGFVMPEIPAIDTFSTMTATDMSTVAPLAVRPREKSDTMRIVVNNQNPLFMFYPLQMSGNSSTEGYIKGFWDLLPSDLREYSSIIVTNSVLLKGKDEYLESVEGALNEADKYNIPVFLEIEICDSYAMRIWTEDELCALFDQHPALVGFEMCELCCGAIEPNEIANLKVALTACSKKGGLLLWQEGDISLQGNTNVVAQFLEDAELYDIMSRCHENIVIQYKHVIHDWQFNTQASAIGCWLSGICDNWGSNIESWPWWESGFGFFDDYGTRPQTGDMSDTDIYPPALAGIDTICDMVGGATVFSSEQICMFEPYNGEIRPTPLFYNVLYPLYRRIITENIIPSKEEVKSKIKVAWQNTDDLKVPGYDLFEADLFIDLYAGSRDFYEQYKKYTVSKKWVPTSGRYYIIPRLLRQVNAASILPDATILTAATAEAAYNGDKVAYFNTIYPETYQGNATLYNVAGVTYILNNNEVKVTGGNENAEWSLKDGRKMTADLPTHSYIELREKDNAVSMILTNYRYDYRLVYNKKERRDMFVKAYMAGERDGNEEDVRITTLTLQGHYTADDIKIAGNNGATYAMTYSEQDDTTVLWIRYNGVVTLDI